MVAIDVTSFLPGVEPGPARGTGPGAAPPLPGGAGFESLVARAAVLDPPGEHEQLPQPPPSDGAGPWAVPCSLDPATVFHDERPDGCPSASSSDDRDPSWWRADGGDGADSLPFQPEACAETGLVAATGAIPVQPAAVPNPDIQSRPVEPATTNAGLDPPETFDPSAACSTPPTTIVGGFTMLIGPPVEAAAGAQTSTAAGNRGLDGAAVRAAPVTSGARGPSDERTTTPAPASTASSPADGCTVSVADGTQARMAVSLRDMVASDRVDARTVCVAKGAAATIGASLPDMVTGSHWTPEVASDRQSVAGALRALSSRRHDAAGSALDRLAPMTEPGTPGNGRDTLEAHRSQARKLFARALGDVAAQGKARPGVAAVAANGADASIPQPLETTAAPGAGNDAPVNSRELLRRYLDAASSRLPVGRDPHSPKPRLTSPAPGGDADAAALVPPGAAAGSLRPVVPVSAAAETTPADAPEGGLTPQMVKTFSLAWREGIGEARMRLEPERLGSVSVSLRVERGVVTATVTADTAAVRDWVRTHESELRTALAGQGLDLEHLVVSADPDNRREQRDAYGDRPPRRSRRESDEAPFTVDV